MGSIKISGKNIVTQSGSDEPTISSNVVFPAGHVLQVVSSVKKDTDSGTSSTYETITGTDQNGSGSVFSVVITPKQNNSYFFVNTMLHAGLGDAYTLAFGIQRDGTILDTTSGSTMEAMAMDYANSIAQSVRNVNVNYLDKNASATAGTSITYRPVIKRSLGSTWYINRISSNSAYTCLSTITVMEIAT